MMRTRWWELGAFVVALFLAVPAHAAPAPDKGSALAQVPAEAPIVIQVRGLERTKDRLIAMVKNAVPDLGPMLQDKIDEAFRLYRRRDDASSPTAFEAQLFRKMYAYEARRVVKKGGLDVELGISDPMPTAE